MFVLYCDTDSDITLKEVKEYGIKLLSMPYTIDNIDTYPYVDFEEFNFHEFYEKLRSGVMPKTYALNQYQYEEKFEEDFKNGKDILCVHFSKSMSTSYNAMIAALENLKQKYPDRKYWTIDTKGITTISYAIIMEILKLYKNGTSAEEIVEWSKTNVDKFAMFFYADNLDFFRRSGRVSGIAALFGNMLNIHPIIHMSKEGQMVSIDKVRGTKAAYTKLLDYVEEYQEDIEKYPVYIGHTDCDKIVSSIKELLYERFGNNLNIIEIPVNPTSGAHCGPDSLGIAFRSKCRYPK